MIFIFFKSNLFLFKIFFINLHHFFFLFARNFYFVHIFWKLVFIRLVEKNIKLIIEHIFDNGKPQRVKKIHNNQKIPHHLFFLLQHFQKLSLTQILFLTLPQNFYQLSKKNKINFILTIFSPLKILIALFLIALFLIALFLIALFLITLFLIALFLIALFLIALFLIALFLIALFLIALFLIALFLIAFLFIFFSIFLFHFLLLIFICIYFLIDIYIFY